MMSEVSAGKTQITESNLNGQELELSEVSSAMCLAPGLGSLKGCAKLRLLTGVYIHEFPILYWLPFSMVASEWMDFLNVNSAPRMRIPTNKVHGFFYFGSEVTWHHL